MQPLYCWAKGKDKFKVLITAISAFTADYQYEIFKDINKYLYEKDLIDFPPIKKWLNYYRNHRILEEEIMTFIEERILCDPLLYEFAFSFLKLLASESDDDILKLFEFMPNADRAKTQEWLKEFRSWDLNEAERNINERMKNHKKIPIELPMDTLLFMGKVWVPCLEYLGTFPPVLFRAARKGNVEAICNLLKIDKSVIQDEKIATHIAKASMNIESDEFKNISIAFKGSMKITSKKKWKGMLAAKLSELSKRSGRELTAPEIQYIFDFVYSLKHSESLIDPDLPESPEAFAKLIQRKSKHYIRKIFEPDKK